MFNLFDEFGLVDILFILNYFENKKQSKLQSKSNRLAVILALLQEQDQHEILETLKEIENGRKNQTNQNGDN